MHKSIEHHLERAPHLEQHALEPHGHGPVDPAHQFRPLAAGQGRVHAVTAAARVQLDPVAPCTAHVRPNSRERRLGALSDRVKIRANRAASSR